MSPHAILSNAQREAILAAQFDLHEREVARYWTWSESRPAPYGPPPRFQPRRIRCATLPASFPRLATEWEHITLTGSYYWRQYQSDIHILRPLRIFKLSKQAKTA